MASLSVSGSPFMALSSHGLSVVENLSTSWARLRGERQGETRRDTGKRKTEGRKRREERKRRREKGREGKERSKRLVSCQHISRFILSKRQTM